MASIVVLVSGLFKATGGEGRKLWVGERLLSAIAEFSLSLSLSLSLSFLIDRTNLTARAGASLGNESHIQLLCAQGDWEIRPGRSIGLT